LVTGGGTGIGRACSLAFAREGAAVAVNYSRSEAEAEDTAAEIREGGGQSLAIKANVASDEELRRMVDEVAQVYGRLDILVNNAGTTNFVPHDDLEGLTEQDWDEVMAVNVKGTFFASRAAAKVMRKRDGGAIVNIASIAGLTGMGSSIAYCASKAAILSMTKSLARVLAPEIRVNAVSPGITLTRWVEGFGDFVEMNIQKTPLKRGAGPEDIADAVLFLVSGTTFVTGENLVVDGGKILM